MPEQNAVAVIAAPSLLTRFASRFHMEPEKMASTLKATAFQTDKPITTEQLAMLVIVSDQYNLNPFTREIYAYPDRGRIVAVVGVDGWIRLVQSHPQFDGWTFEWNEQDQSMTGTAFRKDRRVPTVITEYLTECRRGTDPWKQMPRRMLRNRVIAQLARIGFGFAGIHTDDEAQDIVSGRNAQAAAAGNSTADRVKQVLKNEPLQPVEEVSPITYVEPTVEGELPTLDESDMPNKFDDEQENAA